MELKDKKVAVLGLGIEGTALCDFLNGKVASVAVHDKNSADKILTDSPLEIADLAAKILADPRFKKVLGDNYLDDLGQYDIIFRSPSIYFKHPKLIEAKNSGVVISSQIKLFFDLCPCRIVGVTGTKGKGTTASLIYEIFKNGIKNSELGIKGDEKDHNSEFIINDSSSIYLAGNIGYPAIDLIPKLKKEDIVVLELSNFQLADLEKSPHVAVITNLGVDHLDYHQTVAEYQQTKMNIIGHQSKNDFAILNINSTFDQKFIGAIQSEVLFFSKDKKADAYVADEDNLSKVVIDINNQEVEICNNQEIKLVGRHNLENIAAASLVAHVMGVNTDTIKAIVRNFEGLPYRLEFIREIDGVKFINDSFATNPGPTVAAIESFKEPKVLILGGSPKGADFAEMAELIVKSDVPAVVLIGAEGFKIEAALIKAKYTGKSVSVVGDINQIALAAKNLAKSGQIVIFSPACASFDMFKNYKDRGAKFTDAVNSL
jgi:UDP-N-acetylmuramoylalanine--D-glutamate ligase